MPFATIAPIWAPARSGLPEPDSGPCFAGEKGRYERISLATACIAEPAPPIREVIPLIRPVMMFRPASYSSVPNPDVAEVIRWVASAIPWDTSFFVSCQAFDQRPVIRSSTMATTLRISCIPRVARPDRIVQASLAVSTSNPKEMRHHDTRSVSIGRRTTSQMTVASVPMYDQRKAQTWRISAEFDRHQDVRSPSRAWSHLITLSSSQRASAWTPWTSVDQADRKSALCAVNQLIRPLIAACARWSAPTRTVRRMLATSSTAWRKGLKWV